jgi:acetyl esterase/lipase
MTFVKQAKTPTLIQHGELDRRVPIPNAYELRQGLEDRGVPVALIVYKGFGHGITKPKAMRAVMRHNLEWFNPLHFRRPASRLHEAGSAEREVGEGMTLLLDVPAGSAGRLGLPPITSSSRRRRGFPPSSP